MPFISLHVLICSPPYFTCIDTDTESAGLLLVQEIKLSSSHTFHESGPLQYSLCDNTRAACPPSCPRSSAPPIGIHRHGSSIHVTGHFKGPILRCFLIYVILFSPHKQTWSCVAFCFIHTCLTHKSCMFRMSSSFNTTHSVMW
ncbi:hypothetical protein NL108_006085 [Boleophthalmus pectinirostris]|nr:hypothetical protein NL108_006085 [Boleophthalmus pectinirostris]